MGPILLFISNYVSYTSIFVLWLGLPMAPQVIVYFHKLPATAWGASGCRVTFTLGCPSVNLEVVNDECMINIQVSSTSKTSKKRRARKSAKAKKSQTEGSNVNDSNTILAFDTEEFTLFLASRFLGMWFLTIWMPRNVAIPIFGFIGNLLRFLEMWDDNVWFIPKNLKWIIYFSHFILRF